MIYDVVFLGFFGVVRRPPDFVLDRGFFATPADVIFGVFGVLSALGVIFFSVNFAGTVFPLVGVFCSAARVVALRVASGSGLRVLASLALPFAAEVPHARAVAWLASSHSSSRNALQNALQRTARV